MAGEGDETMHLRPLFVTFNGKLKEFSKKMITFAASKSIYNVRRISE